MKLKKYKSREKTILSDPKLNDAVKVFLKDVNRRAARLPKKRTVADERVEWAHLQTSVEADMTGVVETEKLITINGNQLKLTVVAPTDGEKTLPAFIFLHGGGWTKGNYMTSKRLVRDIVVSSGCAAVFVHYSLSPEAVYPQAIEEIQAVVKWLSENGAGVGVDSENLAVIGCGSGGNMATVTALLTNQGCTQKIKVQILLWPLVSAKVSAKAIKRYGKGRLLTTGEIKRAFNTYVGGKKKLEDRFVSPLNAKKHELQKSPPALVILAECDISRHSAQNYATKLADAGVPTTMVRYNGMIHGFAQLNAFAALPQTQAALGQIAATLKFYLKTS